MRQLLSKRFLMVAFLFMTFVAIVTYSLSGKVSASKSMNDKLHEHYHIVAVDVKSGDRAFNLQKKLNKRENPNDLLYLAKSLHENENVDFSNIKEGDTIYLLRDK